MIRNGNGAKVLDNFIVARCSLLPAFINGLIGFIFESFLDGRVVEGKAQPDFPSSFHRYATRDSNAATVPQSRLREMEPIAMAIERFQPGESTKVTSTLPPYLLKSRSGFPSSSNGGGTTVQLH